MHMHTCTHTHTHTRRTMSSTARNEVTTMVESGEGEWGRFGSDRITHTITATSSRMCSQAFLCSCSQVGGGVPVQRGGQQTS